MGAALTTLGQNHSEISKCVLDMMGRPAYLACRLSAMTVISLMLGARAGRLFLRWDCERDEIESGLVCISGIHKEKSRTGLHRVHMLWNEAKQTLQCALLKALDLCMYRKITLSIPILRLGSPKCTSSKIYVVLALAGQTEKPSSVLLSSVWRAGALVQPKP